VVMKYIYLKGIKIEELLSCIDIPHLQLYPL